jgi:hypothetical protein
MIQSPVRLFGFILVIILGVFACTIPDEIEVDGPNPEYAFPLFQSSLNIDDLLGNALNDTLPGDTILVDANGNITLVYSGDVTEVRARRLFVFLDTVLSGFVPLIDTFAYAPFNAPPNLDIKRSDLSAGTITIGGQNTTTDTITGSVQIPQLTLNGVPFRYDFKVAPGANIASPAVEMKGYRLTSTNDSLFFRYEAYLPNGTRIKLPLINGVFPALLAVIQNLEFSYLEGYWGNERFPINRDTIAIDLNQTNFSGGDIKIKDPRVTVNVTNSFGFPSRGNIKTLQFEGRDGTFYPLQSSVISNGGIDFAFPPLTDIGGSRTTTFYFDKSNSNIASVFNAQPISMDYDVEGIANVLQDPNFTGFLTDSSFIKFGITVELPMEGSIRNFGSVNEIDLNFDTQANTGNTGKIISAELKLISENGMPLGASGQIYFLDAQGVVLDSLFAGNKPLMIPAPVGANGVPTGNSKLEQLIPISAARFEAIKNSKKARIKTIIETTNGGTQNVRILSKQKVNIRMGVKLERAR